MAVFRGARVKSIHLIIAVLALSLFGIVAGDLGLFSGLSLETQRAIGLTEFGANMVIAIYGAVAFRRIAWSDPDHRRVAGIESVARRGLSGMRGLKENALTSPSLSRRPRRGQVAAP